MNQNGIGYNDNAREYIKRNLNASRYQLRNQHESRAKVGVLSKVKKALTFHNFIILLLVTVVGYMVFNAPAAMDTMWEQQYNHKE